jgi:hypothetical protein
MWMFLVGIGMAADPVATHCEPDERPAFNGVNEVSGDTVSVCLQGRWAAFRVGPLGAPTVDHDLPPAQQGETFDPGAGIVFRVVIDDIVHEITGPTGRTGIKDYSYYYTHQAKRTFTGKPARWLDSVDSPPVRPPKECSAEPPAELDVCRHPRWDAGGKGQHGLYNGRLDGRNLRLLVDETGALTWRLEAHERPLAEGPLALKGAFPSQQLMKSDVPLEVAEAFGFSEDLGGARLVFDASECEGPCKGEWATRLVVSTKPIQAKLGDTFDVVSTRMWPESR